MVDEEPLCGCATNKLLFVYLFIHSMTGLPSSFGGSWFLLSFLFGGFGMSESRACCGTNTAAIASSVTGWEKQNKKQWLDKTKLTPR